MAILIRAGWVATMDPALGVLRGGCVRVDGERITEVARGLVPSPGAELLEAPEGIVIPGLVNAHHHTWQTALRGVAGNWTLLEYFRHMHAGLATRFRPEDSHIANLAGALNQINCGTTTLMDWCHNTPTPAHTDAAIEALVESGIRAAFFHGTPKPDPKPGQKPFWELPHPRAEVERLVKRLPSRDALVTPGLAILGPHYSTYDVAAHDLRLAREFGLIASMHCAGGEARTPGGWQRLTKENLLGEDSNVVHGNNLSDAELALMVDKGVSFTLTPESEMAHGHGFPITGRLRKLGAQPSLGVDLESGLSGDMFTVARLALATQRALDNDAARGSAGALPPTSTVRCHEALEWITLEGARMLGLADRIGSLSPGKQADLVLLDAGALNMHPVHDPVVSVVTQASIVNVDSVMIAGKWQKRAGRMRYPGLDGRLRELEASGRRILAEMALAQRD